MGRKSNIRIAVLLMAGSLASSTQVVANSLSSPLVEANRLTAQKRFKEALDSYKQSVAAEPRNYLCYHCYGRTLVITGQIEEALKQYQKALELKPNSPEVYNDIGVALTLKGYAADGAKFIKRAVDLRPDYIGAVNNLGAVLTKLKDYEQAVAVFTRSLELQPHNSVIKERCAEAQRQLSKSVHFDFGAPVDIAAIPDFKSKTLLTASDAAPPVSLNKNQQNASFKPDVSTSINDDAIVKDADGWLQSGQSLFLELHTSGFGSAKVSGSGLIQKGNVCLGANEIKELDLSGTETVEVSGDVALTFVGEGTIRLGTFKVETIGHESKFSINCGQQMLICKSGTIEVAGWPSVVAQRDGRRVALTAEHCAKIYAQDDTSVKISNCTDVSLVSNSTGSVVDCDTLVLNDSARVIAIRCHEISLFGSSTAKIYDCGAVDQQDSSKVEFANSAKF